MTVGFFVVVTSSIKQSLVYNRLYEKKVKAPQWSHESKGAEIFFKKVAGRSLNTGRFSLT